MVAKARRRQKRHSLRDIYIHYIIWGAICLALLALLLGLWFNTQSLNRKTSALQRQLAMNSQPVCNAREAWRPGTTKQFDVETSGSKRNYLVHLPSGFSGEKYYPLIMFFPGKGMDAIGGEKLAGLNSLDTINVYPSPSVNRDGILAWEGAPYSSGSDDVTFVNDILDKVQGQLCVDRSHVYATGFSNGGGFVSVLSCKAGDRFAAYGIVAGAMYFPASGCEPSRPSALINIHGDHDSVVPYAGSLTRRLPQIDSWTSARAQDNGCSSVPTTPYSDLASVQTTWVRCRGNATIQNIKLKDTGHLWPTNAPEVLWRFMSQYSL